MPDFISSFHPSFKFRGNCYTNRHWSSPRPPPPSSKSTGLPLGLIIGASVGGMVLGALLVTLVFFWRRRRAQRTARRSQAILMGKQDEEKGSLITPFIVPPIPAAPNAKVVDWMRRNRTVSVSTISSFSSPTVIESVGDRTSISAYSQLSALRTSPGDNRVKPEDGGTNVPPRLDRINE
ncbi:hypothetical protein DFH08DRAFT_961383 [Mycena albidolilacea]|uniref:Uncharacterized protein n=1 Tax=Mycena albidolilacea TaxID=1033008 RepID=A0AAD7A0H4_9AGAR|nr:hypothetical protein DFH08DRAFT_961383 [Mycena albidolilacea]